MSTKPNGHAPLADSDQSASLEASMGFLMGQVTPRAHR